MRVLALNPFDGGSHRAHLRGWLSRSRHDFSVLSLPAYKWKWRMRHAAVTFADQVKGKFAAGESWDVLFTTDMLNLAEFAGLCPPIRDCPKVVYFHENQLTYPNRQPSERDLHFAFTNFTTALAADAVWFNSAYHRNDFLIALEDWLARMPDYQPIDAVTIIAEKSTVVPPGIDEFPLRGAREPGPLRILWAARWEHDKDPESFFQAIALLAKSGTPFRLSVLGESFRDVPACFPAARKQFDEYIDHWGYIDNRDKYLSILRQSDVIVSTAGHEFFGLAVVEALAAGCLPLVPDRLAYPEVIGAGPYYHDDQPETIALRLMEWARSADANSLTALHSLQRSVTARFGWTKAAVRMDETLSVVGESQR